MVTFFTTLLFHSWAWLFDFGKKKNVSKRFKHKCVETKKKFREWSLEGTNLIMARAYIELPRSLVDICIFLRNDVAINTTRYWWAYMYLRQLAILYDYRDSHFSREGRILFYVPRFFQVHFREGASCFWVVRILNKGFIRFNYLWHN